MGGQGMSDRYPVLGVAVTAIERPDAADSILAAAAEPRPLGATALAVHGVMEAVDDPAIQYRLNDLEMVLPDGQPVRWALKWLHGAKLANRVYGPDLMADVCEGAAARGLPIFLYGSTEETLAGLTQALEHTYPGLKIAGSRPSRFRPATADEQAADIEKIRDSGARIVFVGLGCPRQEIWTYETRLALAMPVLAVGAAFDFHSGRLKQAPEWMQRRGLEWLYRLGQEPRRLWRRYIILNPRYLALVALQLLKLRTIPAVRMDRPVDPVRPG